MAPQPMPPMGSATRKTCSESKWLTTGHSAAVAAEDRMEQLAINPRIGLLAKDMFFILKLYQIIRSISIG
jgi:hypothetical protein